MNNNRLSLLALLERYTPVDHDEQQNRRAILDFVTTHSDCFERSLSVGHITASAWLLDKTGNHALMMFHKKLGIWVQLGGHCDGDSDVLGVAIKEAQEESGILAIEPVSTEIFDLDVHEIPANKKEAAHFHYDVRFLLRVTSDEQPIKNEESHELRWVSKDRQQLPSNDRSIVRMFDKWCLL